MLSVQARVDWLRSGGFAAVDGRFCAPLLASHPERTEDVFGQFERIAQDGFVEFLPCGVVTGFVGGEHAAASGTSPYAEHPATDTEAQPPKPTTPRVAPPMLDNSVTTRHRG